MSDSLFNRCRPLDVHEIVGQSEAVKVLKSWIERNAVPHAIMFTGPSGSGKTTAAYIMSESVGCRQDVELVEINCAVCDPMETIRRIETLTRHHSRPLTSNSRPMGWLLDEFQSLSRAGFAQQALLKILEKPPEWAYFFLCTTDPGKIIPTVRSRCKEIKFKALTPHDIKEVLGVAILVIGQKAKASDLIVGQEVVNRIVDLADGNARNALNMLEKIQGLSQKDALAELERGTGATAGIDLARALVGGKAWSEVSKVLKGLEGEDAEGLRRLVLGYCKSTMLSNGGAAGRCAFIISQFRDPTYDAGFPLLCSMAYEVSAPAQKGK